MKLNATNKSTLKSIAIVFAIICVLQFLRTSYYSPVDIETTNEESLFNLESKEECLVVFVVAKNWSSRNRVIR